MAVFRFQALKKVLSREPVAVSRPAKLISDYFGEEVFDRGKMKKYLSAEAYNAVSEAVEHGSPVNRKMADQVAQGMKAWAMENGATHYSHWFQSLTDDTAEKHDAFIVSAENGGVLEAFSGSLLAQQQPDATTFPDKGIRQIFEARGYTAWDASSPAFIVNGTLCIPTIFISYTGESLDYKTPFLRALKAVDEAATEVCQYFDKNVTRVQANLGWEQEFFLVDEALYLARPDLMLTGRTLMGHSSSRDQQLDDQYFSSIPTRVSRFLEELEIAAYRLGIPLKTRHNELAPNQFEVTGLFEEANLSNDHNQLLMDLMKKIARKHKFQVLFHEKPFQGVNGSGKHTNWSLQTDTGVNVYSPGKNPKSNLQFLSFLINTLKAIYDHQGAIAAGMVSAGNAHRLGVNEAPPTILSVFLGAEVATMLDLMEEAVVERKMTPDEKTALKLNIGRIPEIILDNTDRNRTSPIAFSGNRFEYRSVGASANCASALTVLNTAIAAQLRGFKKEVDDLIEKDVKKDEAIFQVLKRLIIESRPIRFEGKDYDGTWQQEAARRGLIRLDTVPEGIAAGGAADAQKLFTGQEVLSARELANRVHIEYGKYILKIRVEARVLGDLAINHIIPTALNYQTVLLNNVQNLKNVFSAGEFAEFSAGRIEQIKEIDGHISAIQRLVKEMTELRKKADELNDIQRKAEAYGQKVSEVLEKTRYHIDQLELRVDNELWPLPKYRELLFIR